MRNIVRIFS